MNGRTILIVGALMGALSVAFGAFAAHGLKRALSDASLATFETAVRYQWYHSLALILCGILTLQEIPTGPAALCFFWGILLFSGSLYLLACTGIKWLGAITPMGGTLWIVGWLILAWTVRKV